jgi:metal-responsive CopG/Arc/MetJ family transcriptional regulator
MAVQRLKPEKCSIEVKMRLGETLLADLKTLAAQQGFDSLSPLIRQILRHHLYGHATPNRDLLSAGVRDE